MELIPLKMYINSFCSISSAGILDATSHSANLKPLEAPRSACVEPDYKDLIPPMQLRRMSKAVRTGVAAAKLCMKPWQAASPKSIHVGTAYGMLEDSENFLKKMMEQNEQLLNPTAFIQSTHNTVSGQIALSIGCMAHNMTYVHNGHSFESALLDAGLQLDQMDADDQLLVGAVEECTPTSYEILKRFGIYSDANIAGEGASFFSVSKDKQAGSVAHVKAFEMFKATDAAGLEAAVQQLKAQYGWAAGDAAFYGWDAPMPAADCAAAYHTYSGKYATMAAWALAYGCLKLQEQQAGHCWIWNGFGSYYSLLLLAKP